MMRLPVSINWQMFIVTVRKIDDYIVKVRKTRRLSALSKLASSRNMSGLSSAIVLGLPENVLRFGVAAAVCVL